MAVEADVARFFERFIERVGALAPELVRRRLRGPRAGRRGAERRLAAPGAAGRAERGRCFLTHTMTALGKRIPAPKIVRAVRSLESEPVAAHRTASAGQFGREISICARRSLAESTARRLAQCRPDVSWAKL